MQALQTALAPQQNHWCALRHKGHSTQRLCYQLHVSRLRHICGQSWRTRATTLRHLARQKNVEVSAIRFR